MGQAGTQTALVSSANPSLFGQSVTFTATVSVTVPGAGSPTGSVEFLDGAASLGTGTVDGAGVATFATTGLAGGTHPISAAYSGDAGFAGGTSNTVSQVVGGASQSITFGALGNKVYGDAPFDVSASASSGLPVSFSSQTSAVCSVAGSTVSILGAGQCTIRASQAGDANWAPAIPVDQSFTVAVSSQSITFGALGNKTYGDAPFGVSASASSGLPVSFSSQTSAVCSVAGSTVSILGAGQCTIRASQAGDANRGPATPVDQSFTIATAPLTVTVQAAIKAYGQANPAFALGYAGFVNGDGAGVLAGTAVFTTPATTSSPVGVYPVAVTGLTSPNYTISFVPGLLTVGKAILTVNPASQAKVFGQGDPAFTFTYSGFVNGETAAVIDVAPTCTVAGAHTAVGSYPITCSGGSDDSYTFAVSSATLTVAKASTTAVIVSDTPDPSVVGQSYAVTWSVGVVAPGAGTPTGTVTVSDGITQCSAAVGAGSCSLASASTGAKTLTASYSGDASFLASVSSGAAHTVNPGVVPLSIASVSPNSRGRGATNQSIVVTGDGFLNGATAAFSGTGVTVSSVTWNSSTQLTLVVSVTTNAALGARNLTVTNPGGASVTATGAFTVNAAPTASSIFPDQVSQGSPSFSSVVTGSNIAVGATIAISGTGVTVNSANRTSATSLTMSLAVTATAAVGWRDVTVINPDGGTGTCSQCLQVVASAGAVTVTSVSPSSLVQGASNQAIVITGSNFAAGFPSNGGTVSFGAGITVNSVTRNSATQLTARITVSATATIGSRDVTVTNPGGASATLAGGFSVTAAPALTVSSVSPSSAVQGASNKAIVITGSNFADRLLRKRWDGELRCGDHRELGEPQQRHSADRPDHGVGDRDDRYSRRDGDQPRWGECDAGRWVLGDRCAHDHVGEPDVRRPRFHELPSDHQRYELRCRTSATISGNGITINSVTVLSATQIRVTITIAANANRTARNVRVTNPDGGTVLRSGGFTVT